MTKTAYVALAVILFGCDSLHAQDSTSAEVVTSAERFYGLTIAQAKEERRVQMQGVVLYADPEWNLFWLQDETGQLYTRIPSDLDAPEAGSEVVLTGRTTVIDGTPQISDIKVRALRKVPLPAPRNLNLSPAKLDRLLSRRVKFAGTIVSARIDDNHLALIIAFIKRFRVRVYVDNCKRSDLEGLLGADVEAVGVLSTVPESEKDRGRIVGQQVFVQSLADVSVFRKGVKKLAEAPLIPIQGLRNEQQSRRDPRLIRIRGTIASVSGKKELTVTNGKHKVRAILVDDFKGKIGSQVDVIGSVWRGSDRRVFLDFAQVQPAGTDEPQESGSEIEVIRSARVVHSLSRERAAKKLPVELEGVVTYCDSRWRVLFIHDGTRGVYVDEKSRHLGFRVGDQVVVKGVTDPGGFAPMVVAGRIQMTGRAKLPPAREVDFARLQSGAEDCQWLTVVGVVRQAERSQDNLELQIVTPHGEFAAVLCQGAKTLEDTNWEGSKVRIVGVSGTKADSNNQATGVYFHIPAMEYVEFLRQGPENPFAIPQTPIAGLLSLSAIELSLPKRIRIAGVVTYSGPEGLVAMQDESAGIILKFKTRETPQVGSTVEVVGVPEFRVTSPQASLAISEWRKSGTGELPSAEPVEPTHIQRNDRARLVTMDATLLRNSAASPDPGLTLQSGDAVFSADFSSPEKDLANIREGAIVRVTGVLSVRISEFDEAQAFRLLCSSAESVKVVKPAPWWTPQHTFGAVSLFALGLLAALAWGATLRATVSSQTNRIEKELSARGALTARYNTIVDNAGELIFSIHKNGEFLTANPATERTFDRPNRDLLGTSINGYLVEESIEVLSLHISRLNAEQPHAVLELMTSNGVVLEAAIYLEPGGDEVQCIARDVSERLKLERQIRHMQKMDSVGQLAAGVAHDYNNLMTVVLVNSELLLEYSGLDQDNLKQVSLINDAANRASGLTQQLLAFSRRQMMTATVVHLELLLTEITEMLGRLIGEDIDLKLMIADEIPAIRADAGMIEQAVMNLALNARDAMPRGGLLEIAVRPTTISAEEASRFVDAIPGDYVEISVSDTGRGIAPDVLPNIFEPFFTTKEVGKGTGLGLSTVFGIVKQHEGWLDVASSLGEGTRFTIYLPVKIESAAKKELDPQLPATSAKGNETILVVEDDRSVRLAMTNLLSRAGHQVIQSVNGGEALEIWTRHRDQIDLVLTDMVMPGGMSGTELANAIREIEPETPIIYCTGYSSELRNVGSLSDSERLLPKPFESVRLLRVVRELLDRDTVHAHSVAVPTPALPAPSPVEK